MGKVGGQRLTNFKLFPIDNRGIRWLKTRQPRGGRKEKRKTYQCRGAVRTQRQKLEGSRQMEQLGGKGTYRKLRLT